jgi:hypothetical protein
MATIVTRAGKGSPLTNAEVDANFTNLNADLALYLQKAGGTVTGLLSITTASLATPFELIRNSTQNIGGKFANTNYTTFFGLGNANGEMRVGSSADLQGSGNIVLHAANVGSYAPSLTGSGASGTWGIAVTGNAGTATTLQTGRTIGMTGDVSWTSSSFNGSANVTGTATLANSGVTAGTYSKVTVDAKGRVTTGASLDSADLPTYTGTLTSGQVTAGLGFTPYNATNPSGYIDTNGTARVIVESNGSLIGTRRALNFIPGTGISLSITDDAANEEVDITITSTVTGGVSSFNTRTGAVTLSSTDVTTALGFTPYNSTNPSGYVTSSSLSSYLPLSGGTLSGKLTTAQIAGSQGSNVSTLEIRNNGGTGDSNLANLTFHCVGAYGTSLHLRPDGYFGVGGWSAGTWRWYVYLATGDMVAAGNVTAYSDERLKEDWADLPADFVDRLASIKSGTYTRIDTRARQAGSSAQAWKELLPEVVSVGGDEDKTLNLAYGNAALVSAVELAKRVVALEARLAAMQS